MDDGSRPTKGEGATRDWETAAVADFGAPPKVLKSASQLNMLGSIPKIVFHPDLQQGLWWDLWVRPELDIGKLKPKAYSSELGGRSLQASCTEAFQLLQPALQSMTELRGTEAQVSGWVAVLRVREGQLPLSPPILLAPDGNSLAGYPQLPRNLDLQGICTPELKGLIADMKGEAIGA